MVYNSIHYTQAGPGAPAHALFISGQSTFDEALSTSPPLNHPLTYRTHSIYCQSCNFSTEPLLGKMFAFDLGANLDV